MLKRCYDFLENCVKYIAAIFLFLLTVLMTLFQNSITFNAGELSTITANGIKFFGVLALSFLLMYPLCCLLKKVPETVMFWVLTVLCLAAGCYLITHIQMRLRYDSGICYWNALNYIEGMYTNLQHGEYFYMCPHQLGLVTYNCLLILINDSSNFVFFANLFWILVTNFFLWRTSALLYENRPLLRKFVILLSFVFLPHFFYLFYAYGQVPGLGLLAIALYLVARALKKNCILSMFMSLIFIAGACLVRQNYLIAGIAVIIIYFLKLLETKRKILIIGVLCTLCVMLVPAKVLNCYYEQKADTELDKGIPAVLYIAMGIQEGSVNERADGWFNFFNQDTYLENNCDIEVSTQLALESIRERFTTFVQNPGYAIKFFGRKIITTWCEPTFEAIWSGPLISLGGVTEVPLLADLYSGGVSFQLLTSLMNILNVIMFTFSFLFVLWKILRNGENLNAIELFGILFFCGGILFHLFWETSCQYVYPYVVLIIPIAANGVDVMQEFVSKRFQLLRKKRLDKWKNSIDKH